MSRLLLIDGNSILNRAFYGIMGSKMLTTKDGTYTNAVYGFLAIMFKAQEDLSPDHMAVTFDLKAPTARHKMYEGYKANRKGMPNELAAQMPIIKDILRKMNMGNPMLLIFFEALKVQVLFYCSQIGKLLVYLFQRIQPIPQWSFF